MHVMRSTLSTLGLPRNRDLIRHQHFIVCYFNLSDGNYSEVSNVTFAMYFRNVV